MSGAVDLGHLGQSYADQLRAEMWAIAEQVCYQKLQDHRPRGQATVPLPLGVPGVPLTTGLWIHGAKVPFPMFVDEVHIVADVATSTTFDLAVQRWSLGQTPADATSIVDGHFPSLVGAREVVIRPVVAPLTGPGPVWASNFLEAGTLLYLTVTATDGACELLTVNLTGRCV